MILKDLIDAEWGQYYKNMGQRQEDLKRMLYKSSTWDECFTLMRTDDSCLRFVNYMVDAAWQIFQKSWTPDCAIEFTPEDINLHKIKLDCEECPDDFWPSYLGFFEGQDIDRAAWPFIRWFIREIFLKVQENWICNETYFGIYDPTTLVDGEGNAQATPAGAAIDGLRIQINRCIEEGKILPIAMGAPSKVPAEFCAYVEEFVRQIPKTYRNRGGKINMSCDNYDLFRRGVCEKYNTNYAQMGDDTIMKLFSNWRIEGHEDMGESDKIWSSPRENLVKAVKKEQNGDVMGIESNKRTVCMFTDMHVAYGICNKRVFWTNDVDMAVAPFDVNAQ